MTEPNDAEMVVQTRSGDRQAYAELVRRYQGHVYGLAYSLVNDWAEAQDVAQETFIRAYVNLDKLRDPARFPAWLRRVTFGVAMNWLKAFRPGVFKHMDGRVDLDSLEVPDFRPGPPEAAEKRELADAVLGAIASLPPKYRMPLTMFHLDGLSYQKVADFLDIPLGTAKSLIHRARRKLRGILAAYAGEEISPMVQEVLNEHRLPEEFARKVIEGLEAARWGGGEKENSVMGALSTALQAIGEDIGYEFLMGVSGAAFRMQVSNGPMCPSAPHSSCGYDCIRHALAAIPYEVQSVASPEDDDEAREEARSAVIASIDDGRPVLAFSEEESLVVGYEEGGREFLLRPYAAHDPGYVPMKRWPWAFRLIGPRKETPPDRRESVIRSLRLAVELAAMEECDREPQGYWCSQKAYDVWIEWLRAGAPCEEQQSARANMLGNAHCYYCLLDARGSAEIYLRAVAGEFADGAASHLLRAADLYHGIVQAMTARCTTEVAPMPWMLKEGESWSQGLRDEQADVLQRVRTLDGQAVAEIEKAQGAMSAA